MPFNKFGAKKVTIDGIKFDSEMEAKYYQLLKEREANRWVFNIKVHPRYVVQEAFDKNGKHYNEIAYEADFEFNTICPYKVHIVDVKGFPTDDFKILRKLFEFKYPQYELEVLKYSVKTGWVSLDDYKQIKKTQLMQAKEKAKNAELALKEANKREKLWARYNVLLKKDKLTQQEQARLAQLAEILMGKNG